MTFTFSSILPTHSFKEVKFISGKASYDYGFSEYLLVQEEMNTTAYEIRYQYHCSPFKQATIEDELLLVGHEGHFYLYDLTSDKNILCLEMEGYFGHFYIHRDYFYISDAANLFCLDGKGNIIWKTSNLGIDGVIIDKVVGEKIYGSGEWNPPGGWRHFVLDLQTGRLDREF
jgi:hypothetical protein